MPSIAIKMRTAVTLFAIASSTCAFSQIAQMGPQSSATLDTALTAGYYFSAPADIHITGVHVLAPEGGSYLLQNFTIVRFTSGPPPTSGVGTLSYDTLALGIDQAGDSFGAVDVTIQQGWTVGIYGNRTHASGDTVGSWSWVDGQTVGPLIQAPTTSVGGQTISLGGSYIREHLGIQNPANHIISAFHPNWGVGRIEFSYSPVPEPASMLVLSLGSLLLCRRRRSKKR
jgi:hypothetical protein